MISNYEDSKRIFKVFCDDNRLNILNLLQSGEKCACRLLDVLEIGQSTLSHHMKILCESGIVIVRKEGKWSYYSINESGVNKTKELLDFFTTVNTEDNDKCED